MSQRFAVIDCETTGFGKSDRIIEIAVLVLHGPKLEIIDEFDTLINPRRDVGRTDIHGITPTMLNGAPVFEEVASGLQVRINGAVLVAHNLPFDARMLSQECTRGGIQFDAGIGACTYRLSGSKLEIAAEQNGVKLGHHHRALADAHTAAELFRRLVESTSDCVGAQMTGGPSHSVIRTYGREATGVVPTRNPLRRLLSHACYPSSVENCVRYFDMLDAVLSDGVVTKEEAEAMSLLRIECGLKAAQVRDMHEAYYLSMECAAKRDGIVTGEEAKLLRRIAKLLGFGEVDIQATVAPVPKAADTAGAIGDVFQVGQCICFTGSATTARGKLVERSELERLAAARGLQPIADVTKKTCRILVAQDPSSFSGKAQRARQWGIPVVSVAEFLKWVGH